MLLKSAWLLALVVGLAVLSTSASSPRELKALKAALKKQQRAKELRSAAKASSMAGSGEYVPESGPWSPENEPSCEQLREMWRQSKRHSRAAEATNEIPQYADPFARAASPYATQWAALPGEPTLRPRPERRPVVYGRPLRHPPSNEDAERSPLETLRRESLQEHDTSAFRLGVDPSTGVVLNSEDERSPFPKSPAKGQFNNLRDFVRQEGVGSSGGAYERLRDVVRQEKGSRSRDWTETDVGRVVMSPSELGKHASSLYGMQSDAPYEGRRTSTSNRLAAFFGSQKGARNSKLIDDESSEGRVKAFQLRDPPRQRVGQQHRSSGRSRLPAAIDPEDQGVVRGYVAGRNSSPFYSRPSRKSPSPVEVMPCTSFQTLGKLCISSSCTRLLIATLQSHGRTKSLSYYWLSKILA